MTTIRLLSSAELPRLRQFWRERWGDEVMVRRGQVVGPDGLDGFVAVEGEDWIGLVTLMFGKGECEIISIDSLREDRGIGSRAA